MDRDELAMQILERWGEMGPSDPDPKVLKQAYAWADALIAARSQRSVHTDHTPAIVKHEKRKKRTKKPKKGQRFDMVAFKRTMRKELAAKVGNAQEWAKKEQIAPIVLVQPTRLPLDAAIKIRDLGIQIPDEAVLIPTGS